MKMSNKNRLAAMVLGDLQKLVGSLPAVVIGSKVYYVAPRTMLGETFSRKYQISERQVYRILSLLKNSGHIHTLIKKYEGKTALHIHIVHQKVQLFKGSSAEKSAGNTKNRKSTTTMRCDQSSTGKSQQTQMYQVFAQNRKNNKDIKDIKYRENLSGSNYRNNEIISIISKLKESNVSDYTLWKVKKACKENSKLLEQVKKLVSSFYWQEKVRSKDGILLALVQRPYDYSKLKSKETLSTTHAIKLEDIENLCQKYAFSTSTTNKILKIARKSEKEADRIIKLLSSKHFKENVLNKENYAEVVLFTYKANFTPVDIECKKADRKAFRILDFSDYKKQYKNLSTKNIAALEKLAELCEQYHLPAFLKNALINIAIKTYQMRAVVELLSLPYFKLKVKNKTAYLITLLRKTKELVFAKIVNKLRNLNPFSLPVAKKNTCRQTLYEKRSDEVYTNMEKLYKEYLKHSKEEDEDEKDIKKLLSSLGIPVPANL